MKARRDSEETGICAFGTDAGKEADSETKADHSGCSPGV